MGLLQPEEIDVLRMKMEATMDKLVKTVVKKKHRAMVPPIKVAEEFEIIACMPGPITIRFLAGMARFMMGCSGRMSDIQHTAPTTWKETPNTVEMTGWQTKTITVHQTTKRPIPLIAPRMTFTGRPWWTIIVEVFKKLLKTEEFKDMDYCIPSLTKDYKGFIPRPATNAQTLAILRHMLAQRVTKTTVWLTPVHQTEGSDDYVFIGDDDKVHDGRAMTIIAMLTLAALRLFMAEWAYRAGIPRFKRKYIGRWADEKTADTYTREHRHCLLYTSPSPRD